jgi:hypothetical protein
MLVPNGGEYVPIILLVLGCFFTLEGVAIAIWRGRFARNLPSRSRFPRAGSTKSVLLLGTVIAVVGFILLILGIAKSLL